jgi:2-dehydro-3-deoxygluconokinase
VSRPAADFASRLRSAIAVACVGETMAMLTPHTQGPLEFGQDLSLSIGGAESNVAMYLADYGLPARWISRVGDDALGRVVVDRIASSGVDVSAVEVDPARPTGVYFKEPGPSGTRVYYYRRGSAATALTPTVLSNKAIATADVLHLTGITPALSGSCRELIEAAVFGDLPNDPLLSFDVNWRPSLWKDDGPETLLRFAQAADLVFVGADEARTLWDCTSPQDLRSLLPEPTVLVVKDGEVGATIMVGRKSLFVSALSVDVVEVVGAGDAFAAGFITGMLQGLDWSRQVRLGHLTAAAALRVRGDHGPVLQANDRLRLLAATEEEWTHARISEATQSASDPLLVLE